LSSNPKNNEGELKGKKEKEQEQEQDLHFIERKSRLKIEINK